MERPHSFYGVSTGLINSDYLKKVNPSDYVASSIGLLETACILPFEAISIMGSPKDPLIRLEFGIFRLVSVWYFHACPRLLMRGDLMDSHQWAVKTLPPLLVLVRIRHRRYADHGLGGSLDLVDRRGRFTRFVDLAKREIAVVISLRVISQRGAFFWGSVI
ncbi:hypothetical protein FNV43_RR17085 [Rhamnella rubrinervis]|uniref:Uncharacterized protein n=1 Tax=Rhamnella rubrinervis TaxID=2594499 RepID=A0A8K0MD47_9ROSA|nr:hypothetical protein FNV43_RR17085 [Rhamnella rubrinervis]